MPVLPSCNKHDRAENEGWRHCELQPPCPFLRLAFLGPCLTVGTAPGSASRLTRDQTWTSDATIQLTAGHLPRYLLPALPHAYAQARLCLTRALRTGLPHTAAPRPHYRITCKTALRINRTALPAATRLRDAHPPRTTAFLSCVLPVLVPPGPCRLPCFLPSLRSPHHFIVAAADTAR